MVETSVYVTELAIIRILALKGAYSSPKIAILNLRSVEVAAQTLHMLGGPTPQNHDILNCICTSDTVLKVLVWWGVRGMPYQASKR